MKALLFVAIGGSLGALCRWGMGLWMGQLGVQSVSFPIAIFVVNVLGCFLFGFVLLIGICFCKA